MTARAGIFYMMLNGGGGRMMLRREIPDTAIATVRPMIAREGWHPCPITPTPHDLLVSYTGDRGIYCTVKERGRELCAFGVAASDGADDLWQELCLAASDEPPAAPWCAIAFSPAMRNEPREHMLVLVGLCKAIAWAWIERLPHGGNGQSL